LVQTLSKSDRCTILLANFADTIVEFTVRFFELNINMTQAISVQNTVL